MLLDLFTSQTFCFCWQNCGRSFETKNLFRYSPSSLSCGFFPLSEQLCTQSTTVPRPTGQAQVSWSTATTTTTGDNNIQHFHHHRGVHHHHRCHGEHCHHFPGQTNHNRLGQNYNNGMVDITYLFFQKYLVRTNF